MKLIILFAPAHFITNNVILFLGWVCLFPTAKNTVSDSIKPDYSSQLTFIPVGSFGLELLVSSQTKFKTCSQFEMKDFRLSLSWFLESIIMTFPATMRLAAVGNLLSIRATHFYGNQKKKNPSNARRYFCLLQSLGSDQTKTKHKPTDPWSKEDLHTTRTWQVMMKIRIPRGWELSLKTVGMFEMFHN